jgi:hypothetical protein
MQVNIYNVDETIFLDKQIQKELSHLKPLFDQWLLGTKVPALRFLAQKSRLEMLEQLDTESNRAILTNYFNESTSVQPMDYRIVKHYKIPVSETEKTLNAMTGEVKNFSAARDAEYVYLSVWR